MAIRRLCDYFLVCNKQYLKIFLKKPNINTNQYQSGFKLWKITGCTSENHAMMFVVIRVIRDLIEFQKPQNYYI